MGKSQCRRVDIHCGALGIYVLCGVPSHEGEGCSDHQSAKEHVTSNGKLQDVNQKQNITKIPIQYTMHFKKLSSKGFRAGARTGPPAAQ